MFDERIFTVEEVAEYLRVPVEVIQEEIAAGKLSVLNIRGHLRISESALKAYKAALGTGLRGSIVPIETRVALKPTADFRQLWPDGKDELYVGAQEGVASYSGKDYHVKLG